MRQAHEVRIGGVLLLVVTASCHGSTFLVPLLRCLRDPAPQEAGLSERGDSIGGTHLQYAERLHSQTLHEPPSRPILQTRRLSGVPHTRPAPPEPTPPAHQLQPWKLRSHGAVTHVTRSEERRV